VDALPTNYDFNNLLEDRRQSHTAKLARPFILTSHCGLDPHDDMNCPRNSTALNRSDDTPLQATGTVDHQVTDGAASGPLLAHRTDAMAWSRPLGCRANVQGWGSL
jgi:hypothetical protein